METDPTYGTRKAPRAALAAGVLAVAWLAFPTEADAKHGHSRGDRRYGEVRVEGYDPFVPRFIAAEDREIYEPFYSGRLYYPPHGHFHAAYYFPVEANGLIAYQPYFYCGDDLFLRASVALPRLALDITLGSPGVVYADPGIDRPYAHAGCTKHRHRDHRRWSDDDDHGHHHHDDDDDDD